LGKGANCPEKIRKPMKKIGKQELGLMVSVFKSMTRCFTIKMVLVGYAKM
jgi:hypothetical protein